MNPPRPNPESRAAPPPLTATDLRKSYGGRAAVAGVSFEVRPGEILGLLGPNGAGKTTIVNMVLGVLEPDAGAVHIEGLDLATRRAEALGRASFAAAYAPLPGNLTVLENLRVFGMLYGVRDSAARVERLIREYDLAAFRGVKCGLLSSGEQTRAALAKAMLNEPRLLLLDEPTASLDPSSAREVRARIRAFASGGESGVLWTSHNMREVEEVCDRVLLLSRGRILLRGDPRTLAAEQGHATLEDLFVAVAREPLASEAP